MASDYELPPLRLQSGKCNLTSMPALDEIWEPLTENDWTFVLNKRISITFSCVNRTDRLTLLPNAGILILEPGCSAYTDSTEFKAKSQEDTCVSVFLPAVNFTVPRVSLPDGYQFKQVKLQSIYPAQFQKYSMQLAEAN